MKLLFTLKLMTYLFFSLVQSPNSWCHTEEEEKEKKGKKKEEAEEEKRETINSKCMSDKDGNAGKKKIKIQTESYLKGLH